MPYVPEFVTKHIEELAESVVRPGWDWLLARPWWFRAAVLICVLFSVGSALWPSEISSWYRNLSSEARVFFASRPNIPLDAQARANSQNAEVRLVKAVSDDLDSIGNLTAWSSSQAVAALRSAGLNIDNHAYLTFVRNSQSTRCLCWTEQTSDPADAEMPVISGWAMTAFSDIGQRLLPDELDSILSQQMSDGGWPSFVGAYERSSESTYATAWILKGLVSLKNRHLLPANREEAVERSIRRSSQWLFMVRNNKARWKPYPYLIQHDDQESLAISGLVIHVLHLARAGDMHEIDRDWLNDLPGPDNTPLGYLEGYYIEGIKTGHGTRIDHLKQVQVPWIIMGIVDAYPNGTARQRARALLWLQSILNSTDLAQADADPNNWWRAELLLSIAYLNHNANGNP